MTSTRLSSRSQDEDYALFYRDITEEPKKYAGKTVKFKGQVARLRREKEGMFAPGRFVMTCCEADITFMGLPCRFAGAAGLAARSWVMVTATVEVKYHSALQGRRPDPDGHKHPAGRTSRSKCRNVLTTA